MTLYIPYTLAKGLPVSMTSQARVRPSFLVNGKPLNEKDKNLFIVIRSVRFGNAYHDHIVKKGMVIIDPILVKKA